MDESRIRSVARLAQLRLLWATFEVDFRRLCSRLLLNVARLARAKPRVGARAPSFADATARIHADHPPHPRIGALQQGQREPHAQSAGVGSVRHTLYRLQNNPYITNPFFIQVTIIHPDKSKKITIAVPVNKRYIEAFKTREGFEEHYIDFLSDTFEWMIENL